MSETDWWILAAILLVALGGGGFALGMRGQYLVRQAYAQGAPKGSRRKETVGFVAVAVLGVIAVARGLYLLAQLPAR